MGWSRALARFFKDIEFLPIEELKKELIDETKYVDKILYNRYQKKRYPSLTVN
ncbi:MAG: hypothetical protein U9Q06_04415 [Nanoarchaeota archaeon]|nr:hypothetical protein [Nanoarchaeota archaeon]